MKVEDRNSLLRWYRANARELPWRGACDPYAVLVSEMMLQQTTVAAVQPLYARWMNRFPDVEALAEATPDEVMTYWSGLGYYQRARRLHQAAQTIRARGAFPNSFEQLQSLPGLGPYTAAAVASIAFSQPVLALDTNAIRVLFRYYGLKQRADHRQSLELTRQRMEKHLEKACPSELNQALMELGAKVCKARLPDCSACCWRRTCRARANSLEDQIPVPKPKKKAVSTPGKAYLFTRRGKVLLVRGTSLGLLRELYQPPLDFPEHNHPESPLSPWLKSLQQRAAAANCVGQFRYGISGRKLEIELLHLELEQAELGFDDVPVPHHWSNPSQPEKAISSLTRKALKVFQGTLVASQPWDDKSPEFGPSP